MSIPKTIHYCWFGKNELPEKAQQCIDSWKKNCSDYKIIEWNENNFDINSNTYVKEAYESKKYAFVTDYVRLYALYNYGGVYMDTDVEVVKSLDKFLQHKAFTGNENGEFCITGTMGSEAGNAWIKQLLDWYNDKKFILPDGKLNTKPNTEIITEITSEYYGWKCENKFQKLGDDINIYTHDVFCAKDWRTKKITTTENTYTIHNFAGSWISDKDKKREKIKRTVKNIIVAIIGERGLSRLKKIRDKVV